MVTKKINGSIINLASIYGLVGQNLNVYKDTQMKETARDFMSLVDYINNNFLQNNTEDIALKNSNETEKKQPTQISCWTCHRGNVEPERIRPHK